MIDRIIDGVHKFRRTEYSENREFFEQLAAKQALEHLRGQAETE